MAQLVSAAAAIATQGTQADAQHVLDTTQFNTDVSDLTRRKNRGQAVIDVLNQLKQQLTGYVQLRVCVRVCMCVCVCSTSENCLA